MLDHNTEKIDVGGWRYYNDKAVHFLGVVSRVEKINSDRTHVEYK